MKPPPQSTARGRFGVQRDSCGGVCQPNPANQPVWQNARDRELCSKIGQFGVQAREMAENRDIQRENAEQEANRRNPLISLV